MSAMLEILSVHGPLTVQDEGRRGLRHLGVPLAGALDGVALRIANALVGNPPGAAGLEMRLAGPALQVLGRARRIALAGPVGGRIERTDGSTEPVEAWRTHTLHPGDLLRLGPVRGGVAYLAAAGGIDVPPLLGSRSTYARAALGGLEGRALDGGDRLPLGEAPAPEPPEFALPAPPAEESGPLRAMAGPQDDRFAAEAMDTLCSAEYTVTRDADRMGLRLAGPALLHRPGCGADIVSDAVTPGAIQVPADGRPILLLADCQTTGGYAKIATVITADLPRLGRLLPGDRLSFRLVDPAQARAALLAREALVASRIAGIGPARDAGLDLEALYSANLVSGFIGDAP
ncbi:MAG: biotin-dependent carboxyltransferase family protein [Rhodocyclaceae bacterium]|nr:biotin-dependent carboxyltransferase family protein [Rhodocyclaceae bacterium]